jgi:precorrin-2 methylase
MHPAESTHWYDREGKPAYTVKAKDGTDRPTTLRDARKLNLVPSVTSIIKCAAAPGLQIWMQQQVLLAALTLPKVAGESEKEYLDRIITDSQEQARKARERGTAIHAAIQGFYQGELRRQDTRPISRAL